MLRQTVVSTGIAVVVGCAFAWVATSYATAAVWGTLLFDVKAEPLAFLGISLLLAAVAVTAAYIPARRAARVDPMRTIRADG